MKYEKRLRRNSPQRRGDYRGNAENCKPLNAEGAEKAQRAQRNPL
jgi:hypothetical protein